MNGTDQERETVKHGERLGAWVRERRKALRLTQEEVVGRMGPDVPENYVTNLETGQRKRMIGQPRLGQLARALDVSEIDLMIAAGVISREEDPEGARCESRAGYDAGGPALVRIARQGRAAGLSPEEWDALAAGMPGFISLVRQTRDALAAEEAAPVRGSRHAD